MMMNEEQLAIDKRIKAATAANRTLLLGVVIFLMTNFLLGILSLKVPLASLPSALYYLILYLPAIIGYGLLSVLYKRKYPTVATEPPVEKPRANAIILVIVLAIIAPYVLAPLTLLINALAELFNISSPSGVPDPTNVFELIMALLIFAVLPALVEENMFRGVVMRANMPNLGKKSVIYAGLIFGLMHMNLVSLPTLTMLGVFICLILRYTGSLKLCMLYHFVNNAFSFILTFFVSSQGSDSLENNASILEMFQSMSANGQTTLIWVTIAMCFVIWVGLLLLFIVCFRSLRNKEYMKSCDIIHSEYTEYTLEQKNLQAQPIEATTIETEHDITKNKKNQKTPILRTKVAYGCYVISALFCVVMGVLQLMLV